MMDVSQGLGTSCRIDLDGSRDTKWKCVRFHGFNIPSQIITPSKMSSTQRKELVMRFRAELEQVHMLQKWVLSRTGSGANRAVKLQTPDQEYSYSKHETARRFMCTKQASRHPSINNSHTLLMKQCGTLLKRLMSNKSSCPFNSPVDPVELQIPDYFDIIKHPMDLKTINTRLTSGAYSSPWEFHSDVMLTFTNAKTYNAPHHAVHKMAVSLCKVFERGWKTIEKKLTQSELLSVKSEVVDDAIPAMEPKRRSSPVSHNFVVSENMKPKMTLEEKQSLTRRLESLTDMPDSIPDFLMAHNENKNRDGEIEINTDSISDDKLFALRDLLNSYVESTQSGHEVKAQPSEVELINESGPSNSPMHPSKGYDPVDEDVDIVGSEPPVSSYPPVEIEKDEGYSSSSSSSGSSSSDSDTSSSSGSESDTKVIAPNMVAKECGRSKVDIVNSLNAERSTSSLDLPQQVACSEPKNVDPVSHQEGENALSKLYVSPEKHYRAALLKSRFADTILKAREKTLDKGGKTDPEKLQRHREELKRQQREEKARLLAEAKAAEEARKRAEADAAAQAKHKLELEREASRRALLELEKTVEIYENSSLTDLGILRSTLGEHAPCSTEGTNVDDDFQTGMSAFNLGGSNPLEQLGLFMKVDDEEDEEEEPSSISLNNARNEHPPSSIYGTSLDDLQTGTGAFNLGGSNPLEQLGLFMKVDDEEDEEGEPSSVAPNNAPNEHPPSSIHGISLDDLQTGTGGFKLEESYPIEQLGLHIEVDNEEEGDVCNGVILNKTPCEHMPRSFDNVSPDNLQTGMESSELGRGHPLEQPGISKACDEEEVEEEASDVALAKAKMISQLNKYSSANQDA